MLAINNQLQALNSVVEEYLAGSGEFEVDRFSCPGNPTREI